MDTHLGAQLKQAREASGLSLRDIAARTKISVTALEAVERNDFSRLPGGIFGRSFVRAYALEVGLDPDAVVVSFVDALEQEAREAAARQAVRPEITADDRRFLERQRRAMRWFRIGAVALTLAVIALLIWQIGRRTSEAPEDGGAANDAAAPAPTSGFAPPPSDPIGEVASAATPSDAAAGQAAEAGPTADAGAASGLAEVGGDESPALGVGDPGAGTEPSTPMVFDLMVSGDCWISYTVDGGRPIAQLFRAGDRRRIQASRELVLDVGNAGALQLRIDGRPARSLGGSGAHVRRRITRADLSALLE